MLMRAAATSPVRAPSARMSTRSDADTLPRTFPITTISRASILALTLPLRPTVTRFPGRLMLPSTLPSMNSDSVPVISPESTSPLPIVAWSELGAEERTTCSMAATPSNGRDESCVGLKAGISCSLVFQVALTEGISFLGNEVQGSTNAEGPKTTHCRLPVEVKLAVISATSAKSLIRRSAGGCLAHCHPIPRQTGAERGLKDSRILKFCQIL